VNNPILAALSSEIRLLAAYVDAHLWNNLSVYTTAVIQEERKEGWRASEAERVCRKWGVRTYEDIFKAAGFTDYQQQVAFLSLMRKMEPRQIAVHLNRDPVAVRAQIHKNKERLGQLWGIWAR